MSRFWRVWSTSLDPTWYCGRLSTYIVDMTIFGHYQPQRYSYVLFVWPVYLSAAINPFMYALGNNKIKIASKRILKRIIDRKWGWSNNHDNIMMGAVLNAIGGAQTNSGANNSWGPFSFLLADCIFGLYLLHTLWWRHRLPTILSTYWHINHKGRHIAQGLATCQPKKPLRAAPSAPLDPPLSSKSPF